MGEIAKMPRINGILLGAEDLSVDMEVERTKGYGNLVSKSKTSLYLQSLKNRCHRYTFTDTSDNEGLKEDALKAKELG